MYGFVSTRHTHLRHKNIYNTLYTKTQKIRDSCTGTGTYCQRQCQWQLSHPSAPQQSPSGAVAPATPIGQYSPSTVQSQPWQSLASGGVWHLASAHELQSQFLREAQAADSGQAPCCWSSLEPGSGQVCSSIEAEHVTIHISSRLLLYFLLLSTRHLLLYVGPGHVHDIIWYVHGMIGVDRVRLKASLCQWAQTMHPFGSRASCLFLGR